VHPNGGVPTKAYRFLSVGLWNLRKNPIAVLISYLTTFTSKDNVLLTIVAQDVIDDDVERLAKCSGLDDLPAVEFIRRRLSETELRDLYYASDCYCMLARGEAWALGVFEAALVGLPIIATGFGGQNEFLQHYPLGHLVDYFLTPAITPEIKASKPVTIGGFSFIPMKRAVPTGVDGSQNWAEPNLMHAKQLMRYVYNRQLKRTPEHREQLEKRFSYRAVGQLWRQFLEEC